MATYTQPAVCRKRINVRGIVQGVGFRPFVYNLAHKLQLNGFVLNSSSGVSIEVEGPEYAIAEFLDRLRSSLPPLSRVQEIEESTLEPYGYSDFAIRHSVAQAGEFVLVSPDVGTCDDCWNDFSDPANRR